MRAYLRIDPELADKKEAAGYPDGAMAAFLSLLCAGEQQPQRGRFKTLAILKAFLGKRARWIPFLLERKDVVTLDNGLLYIDGWDEWQEGDWTVKERVNRVRNRPHVTVPVTPPVTVDVTVDGVNTPQLDAIAVSGKRLAVGVSGKQSANGADSAALQRVFAFWISTTERTDRVALLPERRRRLEWALKHYPEEDCLDAIRGNQLDPWYQGQNDRHRKFDELDQIFKNGANVDHFISLTRNGPVAQVVTMPLSPMHERAQQLLAKARS